MRVDAASQLASTQAVTGAIRQAAQTTGTSFEYLLATAQVESGLNPSASASTSSAKGLYQFIDQTWLATMKTAGPELGYGRYADAISKTSGGRYQVSDPAMRQEILALRQDPAANAALAGALTKHNSDLLTAQLHRAPSEGELYMAHFLGVGGAAKLIGAAQSQPGARAADLFPSAAAANRSIFYDRAGNARSIAGVYQELDARYSHARTAPNPAARIALAFDAQHPVPPRGIPNISEAPAAAATRTVTPATAARALQPVQMAQAVQAVQAPVNVVPANDLPKDISAFAAAIPDGRVAAQAGPAFYGLFHDNPRGAISPVVAELWGSKSLSTDAVSATNPAQAVAPSAPVATTTAVRPAAATNTSLSATPITTGLTHDNTRPETVANTNAATSSQPGLASLFESLFRSLRSLFGG